MMSTKTIVVHVHTKDAVHPQIAQSKLEQARAKLNDLCRELDSIDLSGSPADRYRDGATSLISRGLGELKVAIDSLKY